MKAVQGHSQCLFHFLYLHQDFFLHSCKYEVIYDLFILTVYKKKVNKAHIWRWGFEQERGDVHILLQHSYNCLHPHCWPAAGELHCPWWALWLNPDCFCTRWMLDQSDCRWFYRSEQPTVPLSLFLERSPEDLKQREKHSIRKAVLKPVEHLLLKLCSLSKCFSV